MGIAELTAKIESLSEEDYEHISDIVDIRHDQQPVCVRPECLYKIHIQ